MATTEFDLEKMFSDPMPTDTQKEKIELIRSAGKVFARIILDNTPPGWTQDNAISEAKRIVGNCANHIIANTD